MYPPPKKKQKKKQQLSINIIYIIIKTYYQKRVEKNLQGLANILFIDLNIISIWKENYFPPVFKWLRHIWSSLTSSLKLPLTRLMSKNISHIWLWRIVKSEQVLTRAIKALMRLSVFCVVCNLKCNNEWEQRQISIVEFDLFWTSAWQNEYKPLPRKKK